MWERSNEIKAGATRPRRTELAHNYDSVVIKLGGSVLTDIEAYRLAGQSIRDAVSDRPHERLIVVVSAQNGMTDELSALATDLAPNPEPRALDLLWSTGELRSVATLALCLQHLDVSAAALNVHECGVIRSRATGETSSLRVDPLRLRRRLDTACVAIVPGFLARGDHDETVTIGRGGSDLTAVLLAHALSAVRCELVKDVPGYFTTDPLRDPAARPIANLSYGQARRMAAAGCDLVQPRAIEVAARTRTPLIVRGVSRSGLQTLVSTDGKRVCTPATTHYHTSHEQTHERSERTVIL